MGAASNVAPRNAMTPKEKVSARLANTTVIERVLPTRPQRSTTLDKLARSLRQEEFDVAIEAAQENLRRELPGFGLEPVLPTFLGQESLRDQIAGFAGAGISLFYADHELLNLDLEKRSDKGANGMVSRVLVSQERILLETPRLIVRFEPGLKPEDRRSILQRHAVQEIGPAGVPDTVKCTVISGTAPATERCLALMEETPVVYAEPDFIEYFGHRYTPPDPEFGNQWHHSNIQVERAWDVTKGEKVSIAVVDNGFDINHHDLRFGPLSGWFRSTPDFADADFVPGTAGMSDGNHGTACAGMIAAISGNHAGGCGVAFGATLNMVACLRDQTGTQSTLARAIAYAARPRLENDRAPDAGVDILCCSLGPNSASWGMAQVLSNAIDFAATEGRDGKGCAIFWACTNGNFPISADEVCSHPRVIAVGRSRQDDQEDGSGFGPELDFLAPGVNVVIPSSGGGYHSTTGTSFAAPCATGVGGLSLSCNLDLTAEELRELLRSTCDKVGDLPYIEGRNARFGHGRVNAQRAVEEAVRRAAIS